MSGWERVASSKSRFGRHSHISSDDRPPSRTVRLGRVQPQAPTHRTIYCNDRDANLHVKFKVSRVSVLFRSDPVFLGREMREVKALRETIRLVERSQERIGNGARVY